MKAIILKKSVFAEGSEILTLFTRELGSIRGIARSVKSPKSKLAFGLQLLFFAEIDLAKAKKNYLITGVRPLNTFKDLRESIPAVNAALYGSEIILKSSADEQPHPDLFDYFLNFLKHLDQKPDAQHICADFFIVHALGMIGYKIDPKGCVVCGRTLKNEQQIAFSNRRGGFACSIDMARLADAQKVSKALQSLWSETKPEDFERQDVADINKKELHGLAVSFATHILERDLRSGRFVV